MEFCIKMERRLESFRKLNVEMEIECEEWKEKLKLKPRIEIESMLGRDRYRPPVVQLKRQPRQGSVLRNN